MLALAAGEMKKKRLKALLCDAEDELHDLRCVLESAGYGGAASGDKSLADIVADIVKRVFVDSAKSREAMEQAIVDANAVLPPGWGGTLASRITRLGEASRYFERPPLSDKGSKPCDPGNGVVSPSHTWLPSGMCNRCCAAATVPRRLWAEWNSAEAAAADATGDPERCNKPVAGETCALRRKHDGECKTVIQASVEAGASMRRTLGS